MYNIQRIHKALVYI